MGCAAGPTAADANTHIEAVSMLITLNDDDAQMQPAEQNDDDDGDELIPSRTLI